MNGVAENTISTLSRIEKIELLQLLVKDLTDEFEGIQKNPNVCGGVACIRQTRIPVWLLENARRQGITEVELLQDYPNLIAKDLANAWDYVSLHKSEIEQNIAENEAE
jgi:uncharacterized protein (DUF433 family)